MEWLRDRITTAARPRILNERVPVPRELREILSRGQARKASISSS